MQYFLGIDIGSVTIKTAVCDERGELVKSGYFRTHGNPLEALKYILKKTYVRKLRKISGVGTTGSARELVGRIVGADIIKNEITAQAEAILHLFPKARSVIEIGGQDSKLIELNDGIVSNFAMNTVCAAGTGSFLDQQASRLNIPIEKIGELAQKSTKETKITGRCTIFAESDMIQKQQIGVALEDIVRGLCDSLAVNYLNNLSKGMNLESPVVFIGGVAANVGIREAFERILGHSVQVPKEHNVTGAYGMALLARKLKSQPRTTRGTGLPSTPMWCRAKFKGWNIRKQKIATNTFYCNACENNCEITQIKENEKTIGYLGSRCQKYK